MENNDIYKGTRDFQQNSIGIVKIEGYELPWDCVVDFDYNKIIAQSQIIDGVAVFERVTRKPIDLSIDFVLRDFKYKNETTVVLKQKQWIFPLDKAQQVLQNIFQKDKVLKIENTYVNKLGIQYIVVQSMKYKAQRGSTNLAVSISAMEDAYSNDKTGSTLIIQS